MKVDFIIVGQGLAGTHFAYQCLVANKSFVLVDKGYTKSSSYYAAGIINPITGRRFVKSWLFDELEPVFLETYKGLETLLGAQYLQSKPIYRSKDTVKTSNDWDARMGLETHRGYLTTEEITPVYCKPEEVFGRINHGYQVRIRPLLADFRAYLKEKQLIIEEAFDFDKWDEHSLSYGSIESKQIVFCEGSAVSQNPLFARLPMHPAKGEMLLLSIPGGSQSYLCKRNFFIAPFEEGLYWYGATFDHAYPDWQPSDRGLAKLSEHLEKEVSIPYKVEAHLAAVRPTVPDRRPYVGAHPNLANHYILNGLGSKGSSLAPFLCCQLLEFIYKGTPVSVEVDIKRVYAKMLHNNEK